MAEEQPVELVPLQTFYLGILAATAQSKKLNTILQDLGQGNGRLYLTRTGTTVPEAVIQFGFGDTVLKIGVQHRNGASFAHDYKFVEGLDSFLPELVKVLDSHLLASSVKARKAEGMAGPGARKAA